MFKHLLLPLILAAGLLVGACSGTDGIFGAEAGDLADAASTETAGQDASFNVTDTVAPGEESGGEAKPDATEAQAPDDATAPEDAAERPDDHGFGAPCDSGDDCYSGVCAEHMGDTVCTKTCDEDCPAGWTCEQVTGAGGDAVFICVSSFEHLCRPCLTSDDCTSDTSETACIDYDGQGSFCGAICQSDGDCPEGFVCQESTSTRGGSSSQCVDADGVCECSNLAAGLGLTTTCTTSNGFGTCEGMRSCGPDGLTECDAATPAEDLCNGVDDDCDGDLDDVPCDDQNPCTADTCEGEAGCGHVATPGASCDDGDLTTANDICGDDGSCAGDPITCPEGACIAAASPNGAECDVTYKALGAACDDEEPTTKADQCDGQGGCAGTTYTCEAAACEISSSPNGVDCTIEYWAAGTTCDDQNPETEGDQCDGQGTCIGTAYDCQPTQCEASSTPNGATCDVTPKLAGTACDDGLGTTKNDACDGQGACIGTTYTCEPGLCEVSSSPDGLGCAIEYWAAGTACDDADATTLGDQCDGQGGCAGAPYSCTPSTCEVASTPNGSDCDVSYAAQGAACDDGLPDTMGDQCDGQGGCSGTPYACVPGTCEATSVPNGLSCDTTPAVQGTACDDGDAATKDDQCDGQGSCGGTPYGCAPSACVLSSVPDGDGCAETYVAQGVSCDDGAPDTKSDLCNGQGLCIGTPYTCEAAQCELQSVPNGEGCDVTHAPAAMACDDADPATKIDVCDGLGGCAGSPYTCEPTQCEAASLPDGAGCESYPKAAGIPCDDGEATTADDQCDGEGACTGTAYTCEPGPCDATSVPNGTGGCDVTPAPEGIMCDDGDLGTKFDHCDGYGSCTGEVIVCELGPCDAASVPNGFDCDVSYKAWGLECDDGDPSTKDDTCGWWGFCDGNVYTCEPGPCELSSEPNGEGCDITYAPAGAACDDGDAGTKTDQCDGAGSCAGETYTCEPTQCQETATPDGEGCEVTYLDTEAPCDDDDVSTLEDTCDGEGSCAGIPYLCLPTQCESSSEPNGEDCDVVYAPLSTDCDDNNEGTKDDVCDGQGVCGGTAYECPVGQCDISAEPNGVGCEVVHRPEGMPCDDGVAGTHDDICDGDGGCSGSPYLCEPTQCEATSVPNGEDCDVTFQGATVPCDDGDPLTDSDQCDGAGNCVGEVSCVSETQSYDYTGAVQTLVLPECATHVTIEAWGASGGYRTSASYAGRGGYIKVTATGLAGATLEIRVGGEGSYSGQKAVGGYNGGGGPQNASQDYTVGGGGASDIRLNGSGLGDRIVVAGGGGGSAWTYASTAVGGDAGGPTGQAGGHSSNSGGQGGPGTPNSGGSGGCFPGGCGGGGSLGQGGGADNANTGSGGAGAGGGGYYGGGGGGHGGGGGGGSSFAAALFETSVNHSGENTGHGRILISW
ncbi:MAG: glycine rich domain-containing protein [Myxococcota bacterium]